MVFCLILSLAFISLSVLFYLNTKEYLAVSKQAKGFITDIVKIDAEPKKSVFNVIVTFDAETQKGVSFVMKQTPTLDRTIIGNEVDVLYSVHLAQDALVTTFFSLWGFSIMFLIIGITFGISAVVIVLKPIAKC
jgi:hypothetical protein